MTQKLDGHLHVLARFARLDASGKHLEKQLQRTLNAYVDTGGDHEAVEPALRSLLDGYRVQKEPLLNEARRLLPSVLQPRVLDQHDDPCYLAQRAVRGQWPTRDRHKLARLLDLAKRCDELDDGLLEGVKKVLGRRA
ncbi:MAG: hypothetical protein ACRDIB_15045 [Ardenticatenaceae bacterium]